MKLQYFKMKQMMYRLEAKFFIMMVNCRVAKKCKYSIIANLFK